MNERYDVVVVGGGAAGLSGAMALGRARRSVLVVDAGRPRNEPAAHVHNYLGRESAPPMELLADGRAEAAGYGVEFVTGTAVSAGRLQTGGFRVELEDGSAHGARRLLVTTGLVDESPPVQGLAGRWGRDVLHCPYCHGWEVRDQAIGVLATGPLAVHQALLWRQWSADLTLFLHTAFLHTAPEPGEEEYEQLAARGIAVVDGEVEGVEVTDDRLSGVRLKGGRVIPLRALAVATRMVARSGVLNTLGLEAGELEMAGHVIGAQVAADPAGATAVPGVWAAGEVTDVKAGLIGSAAAGVRAGGAINADLIAEETRRAVDARRAAAAPFSARDEREAAESTLGGHRHGI